MYEYQPPTTDAEHFHMMAGHLRIVAEEMLREFFGERCDEFDEDCPICMRWNALAVLTENPFLQE